MQPNISSSCVCCSSHQQITIQLLGHTVLVLISISTRFLMSRHCNQETGHGPDSFLGVVGLIIRELSLSWADAGTLFTSTGSPLFGTPLRWFPKATVPSLKPLTSLCLGLSATDT